MKTSVLFALALTTSIASANEGRYVTVLGDYLVDASGKHSPEIDGGAGFDARYGFLLDEKWSYELGGYYGTLEAVQAKDGFRSGVGLDALYRFGSFGPVTPFAIGGGGLGYSDLATGSASDPRAGFTLDLGIGLISQPVARLFGGLLHTRAQVKASYEHYDAGYVDVRAYLGLQLDLAPPAKPVEEPVAVVPAVEPAPVVEAPAPAPVVAEPAPAPAEPTVETAKAGDRIVLQGVTFETASSRLTPESEAILDGVAEQLAKRPEFNVEIGGHTDSQGSLRYNQGLSERRAQAVLDYFVAKGIDPARLTAAGYGPSQPVDTNETDEGRQRNRRVELKVADAAEAAP